MTSPLSSLGIVSPKVYGLILDSKSLARRLLPEGLIGSPYEIVDYEATLILADAQGRLAISRCIQRARFLQSGARPASNSTLLDSF